MADDLQTFLTVLDRAGELRRVRERASPVLEIAALADRASKSPAPKLPHTTTRATDPRFHTLGGPALLLENVEGSDIPVAINIFGSYSRVEAALHCVDVGLAGLADRIGKLVKPEPPPTLLAKIQKLPELLELAKLPPKMVRSGLCQEVVKTGGDVDLTRLPILRCWPNDGDYAALGYPAGINDHIEHLGRGDDWEKNYRGRYITLAGIHTIHAADEGNDHPTSRNIGMYRVQLLGKQRLAMHWHMHHDGARHWRSWKEKGKKMPVAIALGGESVLPYAATAPMPPGISELLLAGFLNRGPIPLVMGKTVPVAVPANAEIVIEGYVSNEAGGIGWLPGERAIGRQGDAFGLGPGAVFEGPFGDHTGFYSLPDRYPLLEVTAITHRRNPIYPTTVVGLPPQEDYFLGKATERVFLPLLKTIVPDIVDYDLPMFGCFHNCAFVKIKKEYPLQARRIMHAIWGAGQMSWTKIIVVVDEDVNVHDQDEVLFHLCSNLDPGRDIEIVNGPLDILDHAAPRLGAGHKIGFDATRKWPGEEVGGHAVRKFPPILSLPADVRARVDAICRLAGI
jgi:4-hydroxy-3-polyprenylbenzoate decarboxylase